MSSRKETKVLMEGWRRFIGEAKEEITSEADDQAASEDSSSKRIVRVFDFDNTLVEKVGVDPEELMAFIRETTEEQGGKYNVSTNPDKPSMRSEQQIKTADLGFYSMFFTIKSKFLPLYDDFKANRSSPDTYILSKLTLPEQLELNKDNLVYQWFEENFGGREKEDMEGKTIGQKRKKAIAQKLGISRENVFLAKKKDAGIKAILEKYKPEDVMEVLIYDNSEDDIKDMLPTAKSIIGGDKVKATKV